MSDYGSILSAASPLPPEDRLRLIDELWLVQPPLDESWVEEVAVRSKQLDDGTVQTTSWEEIREDALKRV